MKKTLGALLLLIALPVMAQDIDFTRLKGRWGGTVVQEIDMQWEKYSVTYSMSMQITALAEHEKSGSVWYPEITCETELVLVHCVQSICKFVEIPSKKTPRACLKDVVITTQFKGNDKLDVKFYYKNKTIAQTTLNRVTPVESKEEK